MKRFRDGRVRTPSSSERFLRRGSHVPIQFSVGGSLSLHWQVWRFMLGSVSGVGAGVGLLLFFLSATLLSTESIPWVFALTDIWMHCSSVTAAVSRYPLLSIVTGLLLAFLMRHAGGLPLGLRLFI